MKILNIFWSRFFHHKKVPSKTCLFLIWVQFFLCMVFCLNCIIQIFKYTATTCIIYDFGFNWRAYEWHTLTIHRHLSVKVIPRFVTYDNRNILANLIDLFHSWDRISVYFHSYFAQRSCLSRKIIPYSKCWIFIITFSLLFLSLPQIHS